MANTVIETLEDGASAQGDQLKGEAYFLRALMHFQLVTLYAKPYTYGRDNMGVILRNSTNTSDTKRASVGEVYDQVVKDLNEAARLMTPAAQRGNSGYPSREAALGLLTRVYLYMEDNQKVIDTASDLLGNDPMAHLQTADFPHYFANALTSHETLFALAHTPLETRGQSSIASMYLNDGIGWGEIYPSDPLLNLYERYPSDLRYTAFIVPQYQPNATTYNVTFPVSNGDDGSGRTNIVAQVTPAGDRYTFIYKDDGKQYTVEPRSVQGEYTEYFVHFAGEDRPARVTLAMKERYGYPNYFVTKFSYQDGDPMLSSPVFLRYAEVILNRAEAYAKEGKDSEALADVNILRQRAQIPDEGLFAKDKMHGYASVLDIVLDERRLELAFEGHRTFDVYRNKREMNRKYAGAQPWEIVAPTDPRIQYPIPYTEYSVSGITQNPGY